MLSRRTLLKSSALAAAATTLPRAISAAPGNPASAPDYPAEAPTTGDRVNAQADFAVVDTASGKVRGSSRNGILTFKGIPYAASTAGAARFLPPQKPKPWTGVRSSLTYGEVCPQPARTGWAHDEEAWLFNWDDGQPGEDCLRLNIWSPALDNRKRPVMFWLHGGGYTAGSGQELPSYDGESLARRGDVVVVSINHRLNVLGYLNLADYGTQYADSANVGMLDIVAALEWVRDNIDGFGGDPGTVMIFGQSGGGGKVSTLMAMPSAKGLFHRAVVESGSTLRVGNEDVSRTTAAALLKELGLDKSSVEKLHDIPIADLEAAAVKVTRMPRLTGVINFRSMSERPGWYPVMDGRVIAQHPFDPQASPLSASVPMIVGCTLNEFTTGIGRPDAFEMTQAQLEKQVAERFKDKSSQVIAGYRQLYPNANPFQLWSVIATSGVRRSVIEQCTRKAEQNAAPAYCYQFTWQTPILNGRLMSFHCSELAFVFNNTARCDRMTGDGEAARALAAKMSDAWIAFARTGNPNTKALPRWKPFTAAARTTMIFNDTCQAKDNLDNDQLKLTEPQS
ncbi:MAG TPA: carboxylesterase/lipase family protein [Terracidiphilus sp.]|nr:carboxylesterase/lipase family protein [Terracidiphilus sp.]